MFWVLGFVFWVLGFGRPLFESCKFDLARFAGRPCACLGGVWEVPGTPGGHWKKANTQNCERQVSLPKTASVWKVLRGLGGLWEAPLGGFAERPCPASKGFWEGPQILKGSGTPLKGAKRPGRLRPWEGGLKGVWEAEALGRPLGGPGRPLERPPKRFLEGPSPRPLGGPWEAPGSPWEAPGRGPWEAPGRPLGGSWEAPPGTGVEVLGSLLF